MKFIVSLAFKNLTRHGRRTLITAGAIAIGLMFYIFIDSLLLGAEYESMRNLKWYETSSVRIFHEDYWENRFQLPLDINIARPEELIDTMEDHGITATPRMIFAGDLLLNSNDFGEDGSIPVRITAIDPERDNDVFHFGDTLIDGRFLKPGDEGVVLGSWFAEDIGARVGYWITVITRGNGGFFEAMDLEIVGIVNCPNPNVNRSLVMMPIDTAGTYLSMEGAVSEIDIKLPDTADVDAEAAAIRNILGREGLSVMSWKATAADYIAFTESRRGGSGIILFLIFIIAAVGISNTMLMAIFERTNEIGMMRALGMSDGDIRLAFLFEAAGIGLIGSALGVALGVLVNLYLINIGWDFSEIMREMDIGYRIQSVFRGVWNTETIITAFFTGIVISGIMGLLPTSHALRMEITACQRPR
jgi:ABC-type lipoprotein release transport system permease subunit